MQQALEKIIYFQDRAEAYALLGAQDDFLQMLTEEFDCQIVSRGDRLEILGEAEEVQGAAHVMEEIQYLYRQGTAITSHEVRYSIMMVRRGEDQKLHDMFGETILVTARGKQVRPKTLGQRLYLETIRKNSVTLGIGPAGTGKTYLAIAKAVTAFKKEEISRIILTRPV